MSNKHLIEKLCILTFAIAVLTSIPFRFNYFFRGVSPKPGLIMNLHIWFGTAFVILVLIRIIKNRKSLKSILK